MPQRLHVVDVFAERRYAGNPLAVVIADGALDETTMQLIAAETNFSETTFIASRPEADGSYRVRIFTPAREIAFAGHPILGTAHVLRHHVHRDRSNALRLNLQVGPVDVTFAIGDDGHEIAWFRAPDVALGPTCDPISFAAALGLAPQDVAGDAPIQQASAGTAAMIVPLRGLEALRRARLDLAAYAPLRAQGFPPLVYLFCRETHHARSDLCARFFFEAHGVREDPATGNGAAFLGAYLLEHRLYFAPAFSLRIEQGHEVRRPSLVLLRGDIVDGARIIHVGGGVVPVIEGTLL